jgi:hypothetical protein
MVHRYVYLDHVSSFQQNGPDSVIVQKVLEIRNVPEAEHASIYNKIVAMVPEDKDQSYITFALDHEQAIGHTGALPYVNILCGPLGRMHNYYHLRHIIVAHLLVQFFKILHQKVGTLMPLAWITEICKLLRCQDPHLPYNFGHLIAVELARIATFKWAHVYPEAEPQAIAQIPPDSPETCIVALAPDLIAQLSTLFLKIPDICTKFSDTTICRIPDHLNKSMQSFCVKNCGFSKEYNDSVLERARAFVIRLNDSIEGLLTPDPSPS